MYKCPKCHGEMGGNELICDKCKFKLKISLKKYQERELELNDYDKIKYINKSIHIRNLIQYLESDKYEEEIIEFNVSKHEFDVLIYKLISYIYLDYFIPRKDFDNNIKDLLNSYMDEYKNDYYSLITNLNNLKTLLGFPKFNKNYEKQLVENNLSKNKGMEIFGFLIEDILENNLETNDFDSKLEEYFLEYQNNENFHTTKKDKKIQKKLVKYYKITGKDYFSKRFDILMDKYNLSIDNAFNIKKKLLNDIYTKNRPDLYKNFELYIQHEIKNNDKPEITRRLGSQNEEHDAKVENELNVLGEYGNLKYD